jgi:hypothetical protein
MADKEMPKLSPVLKTGMSARNVASANKAVARIREDAWEPLGPYPGSDTLWPVRCGLCGWEGERFYSHLRRGIPKIRHKGCIPVAEIPAALEEFRNTK